MFFSEHNPPHFHVKYQDYEAIIEIQNVMPKRKKNKMTIL